MPAIRMLPPPSVAFQSMTANGRSYSAAPGSTVDVIEGDAQVLGANGWVWITPSGPTSARPVNKDGPYAAARGSLFYDTTLGALIVHDGATWRSPATGAAV